MLSKASPTTASQDYTQASLSETALCARWKKCPKSLYSYRKAGKMPPHFLRGHQVRYLVSDIENYEKLNA